MAMSLKQITAEMARRYLMFHRGEPWSAIKLFGLFAWGDVSPYLTCSRGLKSFRRGLLVTDMTRDNKTIWVRPTRYCWDKYISTLVKQYKDGDMSELCIAAGWYLSGELRSCDERV